MATATILWAGKELDGQEEARLRRLVHTLRRQGKDELADDFARFLPEHEAAWSEDERRLGGTAGPALALDGRPDGDAVMRLDPA